jgi:hypothetical protein
LVAAGLLSFCDGEFHSNQINKCMRPTKLLTISAIAGLSLISYGRSAHAVPVPVSLSGVVASSCTLLTTDSSGFSEVTADPGVIPATQLFANGGGHGIVLVTCNGATSLKLAISNTSQYYNGDPAIRFVAPGNAALAGIFTGQTTTYKALGTPISVPLLAPTKSGGDTGYIEARIIAPTGQLLKAANDYNLVVNVSVIP